MEIVTWVLDGSLVHQDSTGTSGVIYPGLAQRMSAGTGILHSEKNDSWRLAGGPEHSDPVHFVQMWVVPDEGGLDPRLRAAGDRRRAALRIVGARRVWYEQARRRRRDPHQQPLRRPLRRAPAAPARASSCPRRRSCTCSCPAVRSRWKAPGELAAGDAVRFTATGGQRVTATEPSEILVWEMHASRRLTTEVGARWLSARSGPLASTASRQLSSVRRRRRAARRGARCRPARHDRTVTSHCSDAGGYR